MLTSNEIIMRLLLGTLFGGVIGFERQVHGRPAGFRTHILVCIAAVLIMLVSEYYQYLSTIDPSYIRIDPGRIAAGALAGVGFIGAGVVL
jgi:putative Mg2+ transporter-C (MgtC) family protein